MANNKKQKRLEAQEQEALFQWAELAPHPFLPGHIRDYLIAIPNGAHLSNPRHAVALKRQGLTPGVSDVLLCCGVQGWGGLWIEMKKRREAFEYPSQIKNAVSADQRAWLDRMAIAGYIGRVCYGWDEAKVNIEDYLRHGG